MTAAPPPAAPGPAALYAQGLAALEAKDRPAARQLLANVVMLDPQHEEAWLQLSTLMDTVAQSIECLQHVIALNPTHTKARHWLRLAREAQSRAGQTETEAAPVPEPQESRIAILGIKRFHSQPPFRLSQIRVAADKIPKPL